MTLADFARSIGISPATARQWKKRGKIMEKRDGFELIAEAQREWLGIAGRDAGVTLHNEVTGESVTVPAEGLKPENVTPIVVTACECGSLVCAICSPGRDSTATMPMPRPRGISPLGLCDEDDPRRFEPVTDSAQDLHGHEGADLPPESNRGSCADAEGVRKWVLSGENFTIAEFCALRSQIEALQARVTALEASNESIKQDMLTLYREMRDRCGALETEVAFLRTRLGQPDASIMLGTTSRGPIDPPSQGWGA